MNSIWNFFLHWAFCLLEVKRVLKHSHVQKVLLSIKHCINTKTQVSDALAEVTDQKKVRQKGVLQN